MTATTVVVRGPNWLGDTVMAMPALAALRAGMPGARITVVGRWAALLRGQAVADVLVEYPRDSARRRGVGRALASDPADLALLLPSSFESALAAWRWRARRRVGFDTDARRPLLTESLPLPSPRHHQVDEYRRLVEAVGVVAPPPGSFDRLERPSFRTPADGRAEDEVSSILEAVGLPCGARVVGLHLGAAGGTAKRWPAARYAMLAGDLMKAGLVPVLLGGPDDLPSASRILAEARPAPPSLVGKDRPALLPHLLSRLGALVSADTGVAHLAAALGVPTVTLFGPTDPALTAPRGAAAGVVVGSAPCAPCFLSACPIDHVCMRAISPGDVAARVREVARA